MIYTNKKFEVQMKKLSFGELRCIELGEHGRGRKQYLLPTPKGLESLKAGINEDWSIGLTKTGKYRIVPASADEKYIYIMIDTYAGYTRRGSGYLRKQYDSSMKYLVDAYGADGDAGRIGTWDCSLIQVPIDGKTRYIKVEPSGAGYRSDGHQYYYLVIKNKDVIKVWNGELADAAELSDDLHNIWEIDDLKVDIFISTYMTEGSKPWASLTKKDLKYNLSDSDVVDEITKKLKPVSVDDDIIKNNPSRFIVNKKKKGRVEFKDQWGQKLLIGRSSENNISYNNKYILDPETYEMIYDFFSIKTYRLEQIGDELDHYRIYVDEEGCRSLLEGWKRLIRSVEISRKYRWEEYAIVEEFLGK